MSYSIYVVKKSDFCLVEVFYGIHGIDEEIQAFLKRNRDSIEAKPGRRGRESTIPVSWLLSLQELEEIALIIDEDEEDYDPCLFTKYPTDKFAWSLVRGD